MAAWLVSRTHLVFCLHLLFGMVAPYRIGDKLFFATKKGPSKVGDQAEEHARAKLNAGIDYFTFINKHIDQGYTP